MFDNLLSMPLRPHQSEALNFHLQARYSINGFQMGLGKSALYLAMSEHVGGKNLLVCPAFLKPMWEGQIEKFITTPKSQITICSYEKMGRYINDDWNLIGFDEVHYLKNPKAKRTILAHSTIESRRPRYVLGLSGTPIKNRVPEWWSLLRLCHNGNPYSKFKRWYVDPWGFNCAFTNRVDTPFGVKFEGVRNADELRALLKPVYFYKAGNVKLPQRNVIEVPIQNEIKKELQNELNKAFEEKQAYATIKKLNAKIKTEFTIEYCKELISQGIRPIIFSEHPDAVETIAKGLDCKYICARQSDSERFRIGEEFERGVGTSLVGSIGTMSTGLSFISTNHCVFNDYPWGPEDIRQAEGRIRRMTQEKPCFYHYIFSGKVDKRIFKQITEKKEVLKQVGGYRDE